MSRAVAPPSAPARIIWRAERPSATAPRSAARRTSKRIALRSRWPGRFPAPGPTSLIRPSSGGAHSPVRLRGTSLSNVDSRNRAGFERRGAPAAASQRLRRSKERCQTAMQAACPHVPEPDEELGSARLDLTVGVQEESQRHADLSTSIQAVTDREQSIVQQPRTAVPHTRRTQVPRRARRSLRLALASTAHRSARCVHDVPRERPTTFPTSPRRSPPRCCGHACSAPLHAQDRPRRTKCRDQPGAPSSP